MSDALQRLAPPIPPVAPGGTEAASEWGWMLFALFLLLALIALPLAGFARRHWARWRLQRALAALDPAAPPHAAAQQLAELVRRFGLQAPPQWWQAIDALRFGRPDSASAGQLPALRTAVAGLARPHA